jgi:hypothetical protein
MSLICQWDTYRQASNTKVVRHTIEIIDTQGNLSGEFQIDFNNGFELIDGGSPKDLWPGIQPQSCRFTMKVTGAHHYQLVQNIGSSRKANRFIVIYKRGAHINFVGVILTEGTTLVLRAPITINASTFYDGSFIITAVDGLTFLQEQYGSLGAEIQKKFTSIFRGVFMHMPTLSYLRPSPFIFQTTWVPDTGTANFIDNQAVADIVFTRIARLGGRESPTAWETLTYMCEAFNMRLYSAGGFYVFQQLEGAGDSGIGTIGYAYNTNFAYTGIRLFGVSSETVVLRAPEITSWTPPVREARVIYKANFNPNLLIGNKFDLSTATSLCYTDVSTVPIKTGLERLRIIGSIEFTPYSGTYEGLLRVIFYFTIKIGSNYFVRDLLNPNDLLRPTYTVPEWTTTPGYYYEVYDPLVTMPAENERKFYIPVFFSTLRLETAWDDDPLTFCFGYELYGFDDSFPYGYQLLTKAELDLQAYLDDLDVAVLDQENNLVEPVERVVTLTNDTDNSKKITRTIYLSTGPNKGAQGRITDDSSPPVDTINWTAPGLGTDLHYNILVKSLLARGIEAQTWMGTLVEGPYQTIGQLQACGARWIWWTGRYFVDEHQEYHQGEFLQVSRLEAPSGSITEEDLYDIVERPPVPTRSMAGGPHPAEIEITGITGSTINADTYNIPMPDTTGWTDEQIRSVVIYNRSGNIQRYKDPPTILNEFAWDNANRNFVLAENSQSNLWHIFRIYR